MLKIDRYNYPTLLTRGRKKNLHWFAKQEFVNYQITLKYTDMLGEPWFTTI